MSLIDGRYEVLREQPLGGGLTLFHATAPDGTPLRIEWFDLPPEREGEFERYRRLLKQLKRDGKASLHDVVSRPGARYVAWYMPPDGAALAKDTDLLQVLSQHGYSQASAQVLKAGTRSSIPSLYGLSFGDSAPVTAATVTATMDEDARPLRHVDQPPKWLTTLSSPALSWGIAATLFVTAALLGAGAVRARAVNRLIVVPDLVGLQAQSAADTLTGMSLRVVPVALASDQPVGTVLAVEPPAAAELRPGRTVQVSYALPPGQAAPTEVPDVIGMSHPGQAVQTLEIAGLRVGEVARVNAPAAAGSVIAQSSPPGSRLGSGQAVDLVVSLGPTSAQTFLPDLVGMNVEDARRLAQLAGIGPDRVFVDEVSASRGFYGEVLSQSLTPYVAVAANEAVLRLVVQTGTVDQRGTGAPDLVGLSLADAQRVAAGWSVSVTQMGNPGLPLGVVAQTPAPGEATGGNTLTLVVNEQPVPIPTEGIHAVIRPPEMREVPYAWTILPGIRAQTAEVWATDINGQRVLVGSVDVAGGQILRGAWLTNAPGPITFELHIAGVPYGETILVP